MFSDVKDDCSTAQVPDLEAREVYVVDVILWWTQVLCHTPKEQQLKIFYALNGIQLARQTWKSEIGGSAYIHGGLTQYGLLEVLIVESTKTTV